MGGQLEVGLAVTGKVLTVTICILWPNENCASDEKVLHVQTECQATDDAAQANAKYRQSARTDLGCCNMLAVLFMHYGFQVVMGGM